MADPQTIPVPDLVNLTQSEAEDRLKNIRLVVGSVTRVSSATKPAGSVLSTNPAAGTNVNPGSAVNLEVSSGPAQVATPTVGSPQPATQAAIPSVTGSPQPPAQIAVPDVVGLTRQAAEMILKNAGLVLGGVRTHHSNSVPAGGISDTNPGAGTLVNPSAAVTLDLSNGPEPNWTQYIPTGLFAFLGIIVLGVIVYVITQSGQEFLHKLSEKDTARGLITFLIAVTTVGIAIILAISTLILTEGDAGDKRFDRGKQVLSILIGVLGTIVGFYFGSAPETKTGQPTITITTTALPDGAVGVEYPSTTLTATGGTPPLKWSVTPALPPDLSLDIATGKISGKAKAALAKTKFTFTVTDSSKPPIASAPTDLMLEIK